ncbi:hypothetical protein CCACVL1_09061 [Corchorus capsularis]|uniref:Uncharacterized protein n=1 Tax=Corchorus capsularis TaxID=210143 RepID=A0A1R3IXV7_COCAP|nr:hypothetical protein CCACVL1_09061 [Corchorus capsularis]
MEQRYDGGFTRDDFEVAKILKELPYLILDYESRPRIPFSWGGKRKRSALAKEDFPMKSLPPVEIPPPSPELPSSSVVVLSSEVAAEKEKVLTSSPATPLSFSPSESDEKPLPSQKRTSSVNALKRKKQQLLEMIDDFTQRNESLKKDIENKKLFLDQQKAKNMELKAKKEELSLSILMAKEPPLEPMETEYIRGVHHHQQVISTKIYQQPLNMDQTVWKLAMNSNSEYPYNSNSRIISWSNSNSGGLSKVHDNIGPLGLLDLNVSAEEAYGFSSPAPVDPIYTAKARAAAARSNRIKICRSKSQFNSAYRARYPFR